MSRDLVRRFLDGLATETERAGLDRLLASDPAVADDFARESRLHAALESHHRHEAAADRVVGDLRRGRRRLWIPAAAAALILGLAAFWFSTPAPLAEFSDASGRRALHAGDEVEGPGTILYPGEATRVVLRTGARAALAPSARGKRLELREGGLDADVAPQPAAAPFELFTSRAEVRVLGTRFTLSATRRATVLDVQEGRVRLVRSSDLAAVEVTANEAAVASADQPLAARPADEVRFLELWKDLHDPANGYFSADGVPYHSVETLIVDAPDFGHLTTSETFSYWIALEAAYGRLRGDWEPLRRAWRTMERVLIPSAALQPGNAAYDPKRPATAAAPGLRIEDYPVPLKPEIPVGTDPLADGLRRRHGPEVYLLHWLADPDGWYGFGRGALINNFQRGPHESVWETIPHPCWDEFKHGGPNGYLDLFVREDRTAKQWRYVSAPDAEARILQALAGALHESSQRSAQLPLKEAVKLGDTLRYALHGKHFMDRHGLIGWSVGWGGSADPQSPWAWRAASDNIHIGYQNPMAAWALAELPGLRGDGASDWRDSLARQLAFYAWLQSPEGALAGGASLGGADFQNLSFDPHPVFLDPPSNEWFGWQAWAMERLMQYAAVTKDPAARAVADRWAAWARRVLKLPADGTYAFPAALRWSGRPGSLQVSVGSETQDVGVAGTLARALLLHDHAESRRAGRELLDRVWTRHRDARGLSNPEPRADYARFNDPVVIPKGWRGRLPGGEEVREGMTFTDLRPQYRKDPDFVRLKGPSPPVFRYHRFWAQVEIALALAEATRISR